MSRVYSPEMGVESAFMVSYHGWDSVGDAGVEFYDVRFKPGLTRYNGETLVVLYDKRVYQIRNEYGVILREGNIELTILD